jgi:hypothetical protein
MTKETSLPGRMDDKAQIAPAAAIDAPQYALVANDLTIDP